MGFLSKLYLNIKIKCLKSEIENLEKKRFRSQSCLVTSMLKHNIPDEIDIDYFNNYSKKIDKLRAKIRILSDKNK